MNGADFFGPATGLFEKANVYAMFLSFESFDEFREEISMNKYFKIFF